MDAEDEILVMGYLLMKRKMRKRRNQHRKQLVREILLQSESHGVYNILWKELRLKDRDHFSGNLYCDILFCSFVLHLR